MQAIAAAAALLCGAGTQAAERVDADTLRRVVDAAIQPVMQAHDVPGMAVTVTAGGKQYDFHYGVAAKAGGREVDADTLFEIGSVSKTFTATLAAYAQARGDLSLTDNAAKYLPQLAGSSVGATSLLDLGTYTAGGLPLQFPEGVTDTGKMLDYFRNWRPRYTPGTHRQYSNPSIGLFGYLAWVGHRMGDYGGYFKLQDGAWAHTFDYGEQTLDVLTSVPVGHFDYLFAYPFRGCHSA